MSRIAARSSLSAYTVLICLPEVAPVATGVLSASCQPTGAKRLCLVRALPGISRTSNFYFFILAVFRANIVLETRPETTVLKLPVQDRWLRSGNQIILF